MPVRTPTRARERAPHLGPERRRPQVLDAALALAVREGLGSVTFGALASEMGVTRPVIYACFRDRVELLTALLDREEKTLTEAAIVALRSSGVGGDPEQAFIDGFTALFETVSERPDSWRLILSSAPDPAIAYRVGEARRLLQDHATAWIGPAMVSWWKTEDLERKLPVLIDLFMGACESGVRSLLDQTNEWHSDDLGAFIGSATCRAFAAA